MEDSLWAYKHRPQKVSDIMRLDVRSQIDIIKKSQMNTIIGGDRGVGKSAISDVLVSEIHNSENQHLFLNISDIFDMTKKEILNDQRFSNIADKSLSKRDMIHTIVKDISKNNTVSGSEFRTVVLDNFESARDDFQAFLRRVMEKHSESTQFIIITREPLSMIEAIQSRCYQFNVRPMSVSEFETSVKMICEKEGVETNERAISYLWSQAKPNLREALLIFQTVYYQYDEFNIENIRETIDKSPVKQGVSEILQSGLEREYQSVLTQSRELVDEQGLNTTELIEKIVDNSDSELDERECVRMSKIASEIDLNISDSIDKPIEIVSLFSRFNQYN